MKPNIFKQIFFIIVIILVFIAIYIFYSDKNGQVGIAQSSKKEINISKEINIGITGYDNINPILSKNRDIQYIDKLIFQSLLDITYDFKIKNLLAKEFSKINDTTYIAKLKDDVYWHNGTKFTAKDVIFTVNNLKHGNIESIYKENVKLINEIKEIDEYTIKILLEKEIPFFEYMMCFPILSSQTYEEYTLKSKTELPIGTGKYKVSDIEENLIKLELVDKTNKCKIETINIQMQKSTYDLYNSFRKEKIDYMITDNIEYEKYLGTMGYNVNSIVNRKYGYLILNVDNNILQNKYIRKAINYAIDKKLINYNIFNNMYKETKFPLDYGNYLCNKEYLNNYNITETKKNLLADGWIYINDIWKKGATELEFNLLVKSSNQKIIEVAEEIKEQLKQIGIHINIIKANNTTYLNYIKYRNYDILLTETIVSNSPNLETYLGEENLSNYNNEELIKTIKDIKNIKDEKILKDKYARILHIYNEEIPFISLYSNSLFVLSNKHLKGNLDCNWYNLFYNIDNWYKIQEDYN